MSQDEIKTNVGARVRLVEKRDSYMEYGPWIRSGRVFEIVKLTRGGLALLRAAEGWETTAPPSIVVKADA